MTVSYFIITTLFSFFHSLFLKRFHVALNKTRLSRLIRAHSESNLFKALVRFNQR